MTRIRIPYRTATLAALVAVVLAGFVFGGRDANPRHVGPSPEAANSPVVPEFLLSGSVRGLFPGRTAWLPVRVRNPFPFPLVVTLIHARVKSAGPGCSARNLQVEPIRGEWLIDPGATTRLHLKAGMSKTAPDTCQGLEFPLRFRGTAVRG